ncbi:trehalase-like protein [Candidatus Saccharibacteria bacterium]|nr:trehalase-like protein [Candidatus Saccharibacteria bacterium]
MSKQLTDQDIRDEVKKQLLSNVVTGYSKHFKTEYCTLQPSPDTYPFQYFWDSCFHIFILTAVGEHLLATRIIRSLFSMQKDNGFVGHILFWGRLRPAKLTDIFQNHLSESFRPHMSALIQPPLAAQALERIYYHTKDKKLLEEMVPKLKKYYDWLGHNRDLDGDGLLSIVTMFETGMDWKPTMDSLVGHSGKSSRSLFWRGVFVDFRNFSRGYDIKKIHKANKFLLKEVAFNTIYAQNLAALSELCTQIGDKQASKYKRLSDKVSASIMSKMYDSGAVAFWDIKAGSNEPIKVLTPTIFFPMVLPIVTKQMAQELIKRHLNNKQEFDTNYPIPSVAINEASFNQFESEFLWRGPTWVLYNWFVYQCLFCKGFKKEAKVLSDSIRALINKSGLREYYNPLTGEGYGAKHFTWSGVVVDMLNLK